MAAIIIIHGTFANPKFLWLPWLRKQLEKKGHRVYIPRLPTPIGQNLDNWLNHFEKSGIVLGKDSILVGHSIGAAFALRLLEKSKTKVKAILMVAGFCSMPNAYIFKPIISTFVDKPFDWEKIRANSGKFIVYGSDNDKIVTMEKTRELARKLKTRPIIAKGAGHFLMKKQPILLSDIEKLLS